MGTDSGPHTASEASKDSQESQDFSGEDGVFCLPSCTFQPGVFPVLEMTLSDLAVPLLIMAAMRFHETRLVDLSTVFPCFPLGTLNVF